MADKRAYFKVDVGYFMNPKIASLSITSPSAVLLHLASIGYAAQHLLDGIVPETLLLRLTGATIEDADSLVTVDVWHRPDHNCPRCAQPRRGFVTLHDYLEHQRSSEDTKRLSAAGEKGAAARWDADRNADGNANRNGQPNAKANGQREREKERDKNSPSAGALIEFEEFWSLYPRKEAKGAAVEAFKTASKKIDPNSIILGLKAQLPTLAATDRKFIPLPASWLNAERWADEISPAKPERAEGWWNNQ